MTLYAQIKGPLSVAGAMIGFLFAGIAHSWGSLMLYTLSYQNLYNPQITASSLEWIYPAIFLGESIALVSSHYIIQALNIKLLFFLTTLLINVALSMTLITTSGLIMCYVFAVLIGFTSGLLQVAPVLPALSYYSQSNGKISGMLYASLSIGMGFFGFLYKMINNPFNVKTSHETGMYPVDVAQSYPLMILSVNVLILVLGIAMSVSISIFQKTKTEQKSELEGIGPVVKTSNFWYIILIAFLGSHMLVFMLNNFKTMGMTYVNDDSFITLIGSIGFVMQIVGRLTWAYLTQKIGFRKVLLIVISLSVMTLGILPLTFHIKYLYGGLIILCFFEFSFLYPSLLTYCNFLYGAKLGPNVFALSLLGVAVTTITVSAMKSLLPLVGYGGVCYFIAGMMAITYSVIFKINQSSIIISKASLSKKLV